MRQFKNQTGFTAFEGVITVVALIAIGAAGYFAYQARQDHANYSVNIPHHAATVSQVTYTSKVQNGASFSYPATWKVSETQQGDANAGTQEMLVLTSPSGQVKLSWTGGMSGLGGACDPLAAGEDASYQQLSICTLYTVKSSEKLANADLFQVSGVFTEYDNRQAKQPIPYVTVQDSNQGVVKTQHALTGIVVSQSNSSFELVAEPVNANFNSEADAEKFLSTADMQAAQQIIASFKQ